METSIALFKTIEAIRSAVLLSTNEACCLLLSTNAACSMRLGLKLVVRVLECAGQDHGGNLSVIIVSCGDPAPIG